MNIKPQRPRLLLPARGEAACNYNLHKIREYQRAIRRYYQNLLLKQVHP